MRAKTVGNSFIYEFPKGFGTLIVILKYRYIESSYQIVILIILSLLKYYSLYDKVYNRYSKIRLGSLTYLIHYFECAAKSNAEANDFWDLCSLGSACMLPNIAGKISVAYSSIVSATRGHPCMVILAATLHAGPQTFN